MCALRNSATKPHTAVEKSVQEAFIATRLEHWLIMLSIRQRVICGVVPNDSVEATARHSNPESQAQKSRLILRIRPAVLVSLYGGSCGIRTYDQLVKSQLLYQLS